MGGSQFPEMWGFLIDSFASRQKCVRLNVSLPIFLRSPRVLESSPMPKRFCRSPNRLRTSLLVFVLFAIPAGVKGACDSPQAHQFDFWLGRWKIDQKILSADGSWLELPARTSVSSALEGCALVEHWKGKVKFFWEGMKTIEPMEGLSVRAYDPQSGKWRIHWMSSRTPRFGTAFEGGFQNGAGKFFSTRQGPRGKQLSRITFSNITRNSVHWDLAVSSDDGKTWKTIWIMEMRRPDTTQ